jgi:hypothetical protein
MAASLDNTWVKPAEWMRALVETTLERCEPGVTNQNGESENEAHFGTPEVNA